MKSNLDIIFETCQKVLQTDFLSRSRRTDVIVKKAIFYKVVKELEPGVYFKDIAKKMNLGHPTIIHSLNNFDAYMTESEAYPILHKKCIRECLIALGFKEILLEEEVAKLSKAIEEKDIEIKSLKEKVGRINQKNLINEILNLSQDQYKIFEERSQVILKSIKAYRTYENTAKNEFNARNLRL